MFHTLRSLADEVMLTGKLLQVRPGVVYYRVFLYPSPRDKIYLPPGFEEDGSSEYREKPRRNSHPWKAMLASKLVEGHLVRYAGGAAGSWQYIFRDNIVTEDTKAIIDEAIAPKKIGDLAWPGRTFSQDAIGGQALMGTPHGAGIAWMLIDHVDVLGRRDTEITVYSGPGAQPGQIYYYMVFNLKRFAT